MLQKMRDQTQSVVFKVLVGIIVFVLAIFGFGAFNLFITGDPEVASVNGDEITQSQLAAETDRERRRIVAQMGSDFDPGLIDPVRLQSGVIDQLIVRTLLSQSAEELGVGVGRDQVDRLLVNNPSFQIAGRFDANAYRQTVQAMGYTPQSFIDQTGDLMALEQIQTTLSETAFLTRRELNFNAALLGQQRDIAYLPFTPDRFLGQVEVSDEDVQLRYQENQLDYMTEENVDVRYLTLAWESLMEDPSISVSEEDVVAAYETERAAAPEEEERKSRHILLDTGEERSVEEAVAALADMKARIEAGASFAELATENSQDPGSAGQGGDLGFAGRGVFDPAFEEALFALEKPGDVSGPVETSFGVHLIQLEEIRRNEFPSFEDQRAEIELRLRREQAEALFQERLRELDNLAFEQPDSLDGIASAMGLTVQSAEAVTRNAGPAPFDNEDVRAQLFSTDVLQRGFNSKAVEYAPSRAVVMRVAERREPEAIAFEDVSQEIRDAIAGERAERMAQEAHAAAKARLEAGDNVSEVAAAYDANWQTFELVRRNNAQIPRAVTQAAFALPRPPSGGKSIGEASLPSGGLALVTVTRVQDADVAALTESEVAGMERFLAQRAARIDFGAYLQTLQEEASIRRPTL